MRVEFDPNRLSYTSIVTKYLEDPRVKNVYGSRDRYVAPEHAQYRVAIWAQDDKQRALALQASHEVGKEVPVLQRTLWYDAEQRHQNFFGASHQTFDYPLG